MRKTIGGALLTLPILLRPNACETTERRVGADPDRNGHVRSGAEIPSRPAPSTPRATAAGRSGCGRPPPRTGDFHARATDGAGEPRDYEVIVPSGYDPATPVAVVFVYHGAGGTEASAVAFGLQSAAGANAQAVFVFPQGARYGRQGIGWNDACAGYDMVFFDRMLHALKSDYCIDPSRVFAAGFSWGCDYVTALMCCRGRSIRAIAAASCSDDFRDTADFTTYVNLPCPEAGSTAIRFTHDAGGDRSYPARDFRTTSALYGSLDHCAAASTATPPTPCESHAGCAEPFVECGYAGLGHALPPAWAADTWSFFSALP